MISVELIISPFNLLDKVPIKPYIDISSINLMINISPNPLCLILKLLVLKKKRKENLEIIVQSRTHAGVFCSLLLIHVVRQVASFPYSV